MNKKTIYIEQYYQREGVKLEKQNVNSNPGLRSLAKLMLNSLWKKFGQRENMTKSVVISNALDIYQKLLDPTIEVTGLLIINDETLLLSYEHPEGGARL